ncbi:hypothetical protein ABH924_003495 [Arthrobacter sp. GAS37]
MGRDLRRGLGCHGTRLGNLSQVRFPRPADSQLLSLRGLKTTLTASQLGGPQPQAYTFSRNPPQALAVSSESPLPLKSCTVMPTGAPKELRPKKR